MFNFCCEYMFACMKSLVKCIFLFYFYNNVYKMTFEASRDAGAQSVTVIPTDCSRFDPHSRR